MEHSKDLIKFNGGASHSFQSLLCTIVLAMKLWRGEKSLPSWSIFLKWFRGQNRCRRKSFRRFQSRCHRGEARGAVPPKLELLPPKKGQSGSVFLAWNCPQMSYETFDPMVILVYKSYTRDIIFSSLGALVGEKKNRKKKFFSWTRARPVLADIGYCRLPPIRITTEFEPSTRPLSKVIKISFFWENNILCL